MKTVGRYELAEELGHGASGHVFRGRDPDDGRDVALKVVTPPPPGKDHDRWRARLDRELEASLRLSHPNLVRVLDAIEDRGSPVIVMELVRGPSLRDVLAREGRLAPDRALGIVEALARGMHHAHEKGLIHRDLKPENVILDERGEPRIIDFGLAKDWDTPGSLTESGAILGTPGYLSPEQTRGARDLDPRSDVWALGLILYELLAGSNPFQADTLLEVLQKITRFDPPSPAPGRPGALALWALSKDREQRPRTALELADACAGARAVPRRPARRFAPLALVALGVVGLVLSRAGLPGVAPPASITGPAPVATVARASSASRLKEGLRIRARIVESVRSFGERYTIASGASPDEKSRILSEAAEIAWQLGEARRCGVEPPDEVVRFLEAAPVEAHRRVKWSRERVLALCRSVLDVLPGSMAVREEALFTLFERPPAPPAAVTSLVRPVLDDPGSTPVQRAHMLYFSYRLAREQRTADAESIIVEAQRIAPGDALVADTFADAALTWIDREPERLRSGDLRKRIEVACGVVREIEWRNADTRTLWARRLFLLDGKLDDAISENEMALEAGAIPDLIWGARLHAERRRPGDREAARSLLDRARGRFDRNTPEGALFERVEALLAREP